MVESSDAGEVLEVFFNDHMVVWFQGALVISWLNCYGNGVAVTIGVPMQDMIIIQPHEY